VGTGQRFVPLIALLSLIALSGAVSYTTAQVSEEEAKSIFDQLGCANCHGAGVAPSWDEMIALFEDWATRYESIDEAIASEVKGVAASSYAQLMQSMATFVGKSPDDPDVKKLEEFFLQVFEQARGGAPAAPTTPAETPAQTPETTAPETPEAPAEGITFGEAAAIATLIIVVILVAAFVLSRS